MPITLEQAQQELRRRQAIAELQKRGTIATPEPNLLIGGQTRGLAGQLGAPPAVPMFPEDITQVRKRAIEEKEIIKGKSQQQHARYMAQYYRKMAEQLSEEKPIFSRTTGEILPGKKEQLIKKAEWYEKGMPKFAIPSATGELAGGIVGGIAGLMVGHPVTGALLGGIAGESLTQIIQALIASEKAPETTGQAILRMGKAGGRQAAIEYVTGIPFRGTRAIPKEGTKFFGFPVTRKITPQAERAQEYFGRYGGTLTPGQLSDSFWIDMGESAAESAIVGGGRMRAFKLGEKQIAENMVDTVVKRLGTEVEPEIQGKAGQELLYRGQRFFRAIQSKLYNKFDELAPGGIDITIAKKAAIQKGGEIRPLIPFVSEKDAIVSKLYPNLVQDVGAQALENLARQLPPPRDLVGTMKTVDLIASLPDNVPAIWWDDFSKLLGRESYVPTGQARNIEQGLMKYFKNVADTVFEQNVKIGQLPIEALSALKRARLFSNKGYDVFYSEVVEKLAQKNPEFFVPVLAQTKSVTDIRTIKHVLRSTNPKAFDELVRPRYITNLLTEQAKNPKTGETMGGTLKAILHPKTGAAPVKEILGSDIYNELDTLADVLVRQQTKPPSKGGFVIMLRQPGAWIQLIGGVGAAAPTLPVSARIVSGSIALGPPVLSRLFTSKIGIRLITQGLTTSAGTREGADIAARIIQLVGPEEATALYQLWQKRYGKRPKTLKELSSEQKREE